MEATVQVHCALCVCYLTLCYVRCSTSSLLVINHVAMSLYSISFGYVCTGSTHFVLSLASVIVEAWKN